ncbi:MAG TPA: type VII secretion system-associated protein [Pseudonocardiaceae bacterium]|nr:type VII secretion system-associated protein [Pseudonocardiaceae bacterium]
MTRSTPPPITDELRAAARNRPNGWVYPTDPMFAPGEATPGYAVIGAWRVDGSGEITGEFQPNPDYRPSPVALGLPPAGNHLETMFQLVATGYADEQPMLAALADASPLAFVDGITPITRVADGATVVPVYTSPGYLPASPDTAMPISVRDVLNEHPDYEIEINPGSPLTARIPGEEILNAQPAT